MNAPSSSTPKSPPTKLKSWRLRQLVWDDEKKCRRSMRITDIPDRYGVPATTWHAWEQWPDHPAFRMPDPANMQRLCVEITKHELSPNDFYAFGADAPAAVAGG